jgi:hypothetical protein
MWKEGKNLLLGTTFKDCEIGEEKIQTQEEGPCLCHKAPPPSISFISPLSSPLYFFFFSFKIL